MPITDLTGTIWEIKKPSEMVYSSGFASLTNLIINGVCDFTFEYALGSHDINFTFDGISLSSNFVNSLPVSVINIFHNYNPVEFPILRATMNTGTNDGVLYFASSQGQGENAGDIPFILSITGGTDATNTDLINWLQANATQIVEPQPTDTNKISIGSLKLAKAFIGNSEISSIWYGNTKIYEKGSVIETYYLKDTNGNILSDVNSNKLTAGAKFSGNILAKQYSGSFPYNRFTYIKFDTAPTSASDYDSYVDTTGTLTGLTSYQNKTKVYVWGGVGGTIEINGVEYSGNDTMYANAKSYYINGNYTIYLIYGQLN